MKKSAALLLILAAALTLCGCGLSKQALTGTWEAAYEISYIARLRPVKATLCFDKSGFCTYRTEFTDTNEPGVNESYQYRRKNGDVILGTPDGDLRLSVEGDTMTRVSDGVVFRRK